MNLYDKIYKQILQEIHHRDAILFADILLGEYSISRPYIISEMKTKTFTTLNKQSTIEIPIVAKGGNVFGIGHVYLKRKDLRGGDIDFDVVKGSFRMQSM